jgi:hypothetical protein
MPYVVELYVVVLGYVIPKPNVPMAITHASKAPALGLVVQQIGVGHYESLLRKPGVSIIAR